MAEVEVERNPPSIRMLLLILGVLGVGLLIGWLAGRSDAPQSPDGDPVAVQDDERSGDEPTTTVEDTAGQSEMRGFEECDGRIFEDDVLTFVADSHLYLAEYDEATELLASCVLAAEDPDRALELPVWSFDGRWASWIEGDHLAVWDRTDGSRTDLPHEAARVVGAPNGFAYWDDDAEEIVEVDPSNADAPVRTPVQATPDDWHCDRSETSTCLSVGLEAVVDTGDYIFMRRDPGGSMAGPIWLSRVTAEGDLWAYPSDFEFEDAELDFNILRDVTVDADRDEVIIAEGFSCGLVCSTPDDWVRAIDLETGDPSATSLHLPDPPPERGWRVDDLDAANPATVVLRHQPNGDWYGPNAFPESSSPELFVRAGEQWVRTGFVAHTADRATSGRLAFADEGALYVFEGSSNIPTVDDLLVRLPGNFDSLEWAPPQG